MNIQKKENESRAGLQSAATICTDLVKELSARHDSAEALIGIPSGFHQLDRLTHGFRSGQVAVIAGRPSMGKTTFALNVADFLATNEESSAAVAYFSLQQNSHQLAKRLLSARSGIRRSDLSHRLINGNNRGHLGTALEDLSRAALFIDDSPWLDIAELEQRARRLSTERLDLRLLVIDDVQRLRQNDQAARGDTRDDHIGDAIARLACDIGVTVLVISGLDRRRIERRINKRPNFGDLFGTDSIAEIADVAILIYRDEVYNLDSPLRGQANIEVARNCCGDIGEFTLSFDGQCGRFQDFNPFMDGEELIDCGS